MNMKRFLSLLLLLTCAALPACTPTPTPPADTTVATTDPATAPSTEPTGTTEAATEEETTEAETEAPMYYVRTPAVTFQTFLKRGRLTEKIISCDRFVGWVLYDMGYTDQPTDSGMFVWANASSSDHNLMVFLEKHNYERIDRTTDFRAGDIVFVRPTTSSGGSPYGAHVFICAGDTGRGGQFYRYDHGSDTRIQSTQPSREAITELFCVYRPTQTTMADVPTEP